VQVEYVVQDFELRNPLQAFEFLFQFYNFVAGVKANASRLTPNQNGKMLVANITTSLESFTTEGTNRQKDDGGDGNGGNGGNGRGGNTKRSRGPVFDQPHIYHALAQRGYYIQLEEEIEGWTPLDPVRYPPIKLDQVFDRYRLLL